MRKLRTVAPIFAATVLIALVACKPKDNDSSRADQPNIVLITLDTTRADHLGCYGYFRDTSPALDAFAKESIVFDRCIAPMATTLPTHTSILTATYPTEHGVLANVKHGGSRFKPSPKLRSFASVCQDAGYRTAAFVSATPLKRDSGIAAGFGTFRQPKDKVRARKAEKTNRAVLEWLSVPDEGPFFLWVHFFDPHWPYKPPEPFDTMYQTDQKLETYLADRQFSKQVEREMIAKKEGLAKVSEARSVANAYDGEIRYLDSQLARLFDKLESLPGYDNTVVLVIGDHGEGLCQHGKAAHGGTWNEQLRVPMIIRVPFEPPRRVDHVVSVVDAIPTLLGLIKAPLLDVFLEQASGRDVLIPGFKPTAVLSQDTGRKLSDPDYRYCLTGERWKYFSIHESENKVREELYDLIADPFELHDISDRIRQEDAQTIRTLDTALHDQLRAQALRGKALRSGMQEVHGPNDPDIRRELGGLGYIDGGEDDNDEKPKDGTDP